MAFVLFCVVCLFVFKWFVNLFFLDVVTTDGNAKAGLGKDYNHDVRTVYFDPGETYVEFGITVNDDDVVEHPETFQLELLNIVGGVIAEPNTAEISIEDNDGNSHLLKLFKHIFMSN